MRGTVLLFDIDGTLINTAGAGLRAMAAGLEACHRGGSQWLTFGLSGMTDRLIVARALEIGGHPDAPLEPVLAAYLEHLPGELQRARERYCVFPGVPQLMQTLRQLPGVALGLGTGNLEPGARLKLQPTGLNPCFAFGGFGSDATQRADLLRVGAQRGAQRLGLALDQVQVVVIGDTPLDVAAGLAIDARCVGVTTGRFDEQALRQRGAHHVFETLADPMVLDALVDPSHG